MSKTAVLLINVGTPDEPKVKAVRRYLRQFLNDRRVIDLPWVLQKILVNLIIVPFRAPKSTKLYKRLWTPEGSPLVTNTLELQKKLQEKRAKDTDFFIAMRYQNPSIAKALQSIKQEQYDKIIILPLFPQYASSTSGTAIQAVWKYISKWNVIPTVETISQFYDHPAFIDAFARKVKAYQPQDYDHVLFSYHGLPNRQLEKTHPGVAVSSCHCTEEMPAHGNFCYKATCYETTRQLAGRLGLTKNSYSTSFQSRLSRNWMTPFTDKTLIKLVNKGQKRVLVAAPAFVADCLETTVEIGYEYQKMFIEKGGEKLVMVESLNADNEWARAIFKIIDLRNKSLLSGK
ncbi:MAG: ferrochelatase [Prolixibacteraceae bacterium]|nr:ferrochelatase [Prolixibacteraceae bacterium]